MHAFTLKKHKETGESHLFKGDMNPAGSESLCTSAHVSECKEMTKDDSAGNKFACKTEDQARKLIAEIGRPVCGTCVSTLYATKKK